MSVEQVRRKGLDGLPDSLTITLPDLAARIDIGVPVVREAANSGALKTVPWGTGRQRKCTVGAARR